MTDTVTVAYDPLGTLASAADADSQLTFTYDPVGRLTQAQKRRRARSRPRRSAIPTT